MKIYYDKIEEDFLPITTSFTFEDDDEKIDIKNFSGELVKAEGFYLLHGTISFSLQTICDRCAGSAVINGDGVVSVCIQPEGTAEGANAPEYEMQDADGDIYMTDPEYVDLHEILRQEAILMLPAKRLCSEDCANHDVEEDLEEEVEIDRNMPFKGLSNLKKKLEE